MRLRATMIEIFLLLLATATSTGEIKERLVVAPMQSASQARLAALLTVNESEDCSGGDDNDALVAEFKSDRAVFSQRIWLNSRESAIGGPLHVIRQGELIRAEVEIVVAPIGKGEAVATCIRPVQLVLDVFDLPKDDYDVRFERKPAP